MNAPEQVARRLFKVLEGEQSERGTQGGPARQPNGHVFRFFEPFRSPGSRRPGLVRSPSQQRREKGLLRWWTKCKPIWHEVLLSTVALCRRCRSGKRSRGKRKVYSTRSLTNERVGDPAAPETGERKQ
jgi:hypothetical protein